MVENDPLYFDTFFISSLLVITKWFSAVDNFFFGKSKPGKLDFLINEKQRQKLFMPVELLHQKTFWDIHFHVA